MMVFLPQPKPGRAPKSKPKRMRHVRKGLDSKFWAARRAEVLAENVTCRLHPPTGPMARKATEVAHIHGLQRGRSRNDPDATCSQCRTRLNDMENLVGVCSMSGCNEAVARPCPGKRP